MRAFLVAPLLLLALAGCSSPPEGAADDPAAADPEAPFVPPGDSKAQPRMRFDAAEFEQTASYSGELSPGSCTPLSCPEVGERIDVTAQVPSGAPVELTAIITADGDVEARIEVEGGTIQRSSSQWGSGRAEVAATVVLQDAGTVTLVVLHGDFFSFINPAAEPVAFAAEVRTAVRPDVLPAYLPVFVKLAPGDRVTAMGEDAGEIDAIVVIPPGQDPIHQMDNLTFEVAAGMPSGDYIIMVMGPQAMLHGPNVTLEAAPIQHHIGEDRAVTSGQPLAWTTEIPGTPVYAGLVLMMGESGGLDNTRVSYYNGYTMAIRQGGADLASEDNPPCGLPCDMNGPGGYRSWSIGTGTFPEGLRVGAVDFEVTNDMSQGLHAYEVLGYIAPRA